MAGRRGRDGRQGADRRVDLALVGLPRVTPPAKIGVPPKGAAKPNAIERGMLRRLARPGNFLLITQRAGRDPLYSEADGTVINGASGPLTPREFARVQPWLAAVKGESLFGEVPQRYTVRRPPMSKGEEMLFGGDAGHVDDRGDETEAGEVAVLQSALRNLEAELRDRDERIADLVADNDKLIAETEKLNRQLSSAHAPTARPTISVIRLKPGKGEVRAWGEIIVRPLDLIIRDVALVQGRGGQFVSLPSKEFAGHAGQRRFSDVLAFPDDDRARRFKAACLKAMQRAYAVWRSSADDEVA